MQFIMKKSGNTVLITGGSSGIGLALAKKFLQEGNQVIITGRQEEKLKRVKAKYQEVVYEVADIAKEVDRQKLVEKYPDVNILINNAGVQYNYIFSQEKNARSLIEMEFNINLIGPVLLIQLFLPKLLQKEEAAIINVSSGLALVPKESAPVYCASKAGVHIFSKALRYQLEGTNIKLFEIIPALVDTEMTKGRGKGKITPEKLTKEFWRNFKRNKYEIHIGKAKLLNLVNRMVPWVADKIMRKGL